MTDAQWKRVWDLYEVGHSLPPGEVERFLAGISDDAEIVSEVRGLLAGLPEAEREEEGTFRGQRLGAYEVLQRVGRGASADVYMARDTRLNRMVALKFLKGGDAGLNRRFLLEAQSVSALNHPNIVTVHEVLEGTSGPVLVMEMVEGDPLRRRCGASVAEREAVRIGLQIAQALAAAHAKGFVHRDLKPENVMVRPDGYVKVLDFGLVRRWAEGGAGENLTSTAGLPVGTLRYMSPEQCRGEGATPKSDVFALGLMMYELLAGRHPFAESAGLEVAHALATAEAPALKGVHTALGAIVGRMLAKDPQSRPTAEEAVAELEALSGAGPIGVREPALPRQHVTRRRLAGAALGVTAAAAAAAIWWRKRPPADGVLLRGGAIRDPAFSPDGEEIVFAWRKPGEESSRLYLIPVRGGEPRALTSGMNDDSDPIWSPDGTRICFWRRGKGECAAYEIGRDGRSERRVTTLHVSEGWGTRLGWLGSGKITATDPWPGGGFRLFEVDLKSGDKRLLLPENVGTGDGVARVSPDGATLLYARAFGMNTTDLYMRPVAGGPERRLTFDERLKSQMRWSPDGRSVIYRSPKPLWKLWEIGIDGKGDRPAAIPAMAHGSFDVGRGPDGKRQMVIAQLADQASIWRAERMPDGSFARLRRLIAAGPGLMDVYPSIAPDGRRIAFMSTRTGDLEIWTADSDGSNPQQITTLGTQSLSIPAWTSDGRRLISSGRLSGAPALFLVDAASGAKPEILASPVGREAGPQFTPDYRFVTFLANAGTRQELFRMPSQGGAPQQLTRDGCLLHRHSPDGRWIYFIRGNDIPGLFRIPAAGGKEELVLPEMRSVMNRSWTVARSGVYYAVQVEPEGKPGGAAEWEVRHYDPARGSRRTLLRVPLAPPRWSGTLSVAADESWMLIPLADPVVGELVYYPDWR